TVPVVDYDAGAAGGEPRGGSGAVAGSGASNSGWGAPPVATPRGAYGGSHAAPANSPPASHGWDSGAGGGWDVATPSASGGGGGGGWDLGSSAASRGSGWGSGSSGNWGTPAPFTPGALPQTPGGPFPQTPGSTGGYYDAPTPGARADGAADGFFGWAVPRAVVVLGASGQRATIKEVAAERQQAVVQLESGGTQVIDRHSVARIDPRPVRAEKRDRVVVIRGARKGVLGTMVGKDGSEALFQADGDSNWQPEPLRNLAIYNERA
ncbi:hypothetical protein IWW51_002196, partial [Coemansia sp. RSA 2702]